MSENGREIHSGEKKFEIIAEIPCTVDDFPAEFSMSGKRLRLKSKAFLPSVGSGVNVLLDKVHNFRKPGKKLTILVVEEQSDV